MPQALIGEAVELVCSGQLETLESCQRNKPDIVKELDVFFNTKVSDDIREVITITNNVSALCCCRRI